MGDEDVLDRFIELAWPEGPVILCIVAAVVAVVAWRRGYDGLYANAGACSLLGGLVVVGQVVIEGWPTVLWLMGGGGAIAACHFARGTRTTLRHALAIAVRNALIAATIGVAVVVVMQVVLAYMADGHAERMRAWNEALMRARFWLEDVVYLGPTRLAILLVMLVAVTLVLSPSLALLRSYRRISGTCVRALLALTVATSFTFFTGRGADAQRAWVARIGPEVGEGLAELDQANDEVAKLAALEHAVATADPQTSKALVEIADAIERHPASDDNRVAILSKLVDEAPREALAERMNRIVEQHGQRAERSIARLRRIRENPLAIRPADVAELGVVRGRARAAVFESRAAVRELLGEVVAGDSLTGQLVRRVLDSVVDRVPSADRVLTRSFARNAIEAPGAPPPRVWQFDVKTMLQQGADAATTADDIVLELAANRRETRFTRTARKWTALEREFMAGSRALPETLAPRFPTGMGDVWRRPRIGSLEPEPLRPVKPRFPAATESEWLRDASAAERSLEPRNLELRARSGLPVRSFWSSLRRVLLKPRRSRRSRRRKRSCW